MDGMIFYLHPCARTSAEWLNDKHTKTMLMESGRLLSAAIAWYTFDDDSYFAFPKSYLDSQFVAWMRDSALHAQWVLSHYCALADKYRKLFAPTYRSWKVEKQLSLLVNTVFPDSPWQNPPVCVPECFHGTTPDESYRNLYLALHVKLGSYRRCTAPFWARRYLDAAGSNAIDSFSY